jgi:hypothetical protein
VLVARCKFVGAIQVNWSRPVFHVSLMILPFVSQSVEPHVRQNVTV